MSEEWRDLKEGWQRLRWARLQTSAFADAEDAAKSLSMKGGTYRAYERAPGTSRHTPLNHEMARKFARKFGVSWVWLLTGEGEPFEASESRLERALFAAMEAPDEQQDLIADVVERILKAG